MEAKERMVRDLELFSGCSRDEVDWVLHNGDVVDVRRGSVIAQRGRYAKEFMVVVDGSARADGRERFGRSRSFPASFFGHEEIAADRPHTSTVEAIGWPARAGLRGPRVPRVRRVRADGGPQAERPDRKHVPAPASYRRRLAVAS